MNAECETLKAKRRRLEEALGLSIVKPSAQLQEFARVKRSPGEKGFLYGLVALF
jgi:hypothetical protein